MVVTGSRSNQRQTGQAICHEIAQIHFPVHGWLSRRRSGSVDLSFAPQVTHYGAQVVGREPRCPGEFCRFWKDGFCASGLERSPGCSEVGSMVATEGPVQAQLAETANRPDAFWGELVGSCEQGQSDGQVKCSCLRRGDGRGEIHRAGKARPPASAGEQGRADSQGCIPSSTRRQAGYMESEATFRPDFDGHGKGLGASVGGAERLGPHA